MTLDTSTRRPAFANEQDPGDAATAPAAVGGDEWRQARRAIQREQRGLDIGYDGLGLSHRNEAARLVPGEDVDRPALAVDRKSCFDLDLPASCSEPANGRIDDRGVRFVQQAIQPLALPPHVELNVGTDRLAQHSELVEGHPADPAKLDSAYRALRYPGLRPQIHLP